MSLKRNKLEAGESLEPRVMLSGAVPGAEAPVAAEGPTVEVESISTEPGVIVNVDGVEVINPLDNVVASETDGIQVNADATISNDGEIAGALNGVNFSNGQGSGTLNNSLTGLITSDSRAVNIGGEVVLNNDGEILGTGNQRNGTVYSDVLANNFTVNNNGVIDAGEGLEGAGFSAELAEEGTNFVLENTGSIDGRGNASAGAATAGDGVRLERSRVDGALPPGETATFTGEINNSGTITSEGANGTVGGFRAVNGVNFQGELNNSDLIAGVQNGVYFGTGDHTGGVVNNSGTIASDSRAFNIDGTGLEINNEGTIVATGTQRNGTVYADSTAQDFSLNNSGTIDAGEGLEGAGFSVELDELGNDFLIDNSGLIQGRGNADAGSTTAGDGIRLERTRVDGALDGTTTGLFTGTILNSGEVRSEGANGTVGGFRAVNGVDFQGELINSGTIAGAQNGIYFGTGDHTGSTITNSGVVSSDSRAVNIDGNGLTLLNSGSIEATGRQRNGTVYVDATGDNFVINNDGSIDARPGAGSGVSVQVGSFDGDVQAGSIVNSGEIFGAGDQPVDVGVRLFTSVEGETVFDGNIVNSGLISSEQAAAVLVEDGVIFGGEFINSGTVDGAIELSSGDVILNSGSVVQLDIASFTDVEQIDADNSVLQAGGVLELNFEEGFSPFVGQTFDVLDFAEVRGSFDAVVSEQFALDTSNLLVDGTVTVLGVAENGFSVEAINQPLESLTTDQTPEELVTEAISNNLYFNVHTNDFPGGEIRGQLLLQSDTTVNGVRTIQLRADLDAAQEPGPLSDSDATGVGLVTIVDNGHEISYSASLSVDGITPEDLLPVAGISAIHIHNAPAGVNGPVITDVIQDAGGDTLGNALFPQVDTGDGDVFVEALADAELAEAPEAPVDPAPEAVVAEAPEAPVDPAPEAVVAEAPEDPVDPAPEAPAPEALVAEAPVAEAPETPAPAPEAVETEPLVATEVVAPTPLVAEDLLDEAPVTTLGFSDLQQVLQDVETRQAEAEARLQARLARLEALRAAVAGAGDIRSAFLARS